MREPVERPTLAVYRDLAALPPVRWAVELGAFQFLTVLPTAAGVVIVVLSAAVGVEHPSVNFGMVFTWVVWWSALLLSFVLFGRAWCLVCPVGALGEWLQRLSFWWRSPRTAGLDWAWPRRLRGLWLPTALFVAFVFLDNGYGMSNSPRMTAGLVVVLTLGAAWVALLFERRAFCRYLCPLSAFIGLLSLASMLELRRRDPGACGAACPTKDCYRGNERRYGCPMGEFPGGGMESNLHCNLCTECVKSCPRDNLVLRFRPPGLDLWAMSRPRLDGAVGAVVIVGLATVVPLLLILLLPATRSLFSLVLPAGVPPNDPPRLAAVATLLAMGVGASLGLVSAFSLLARLAAGRATTRALFARYAFTLIPLGLSRLLADVLDHVLRTWGALGDVTRALMLDFPLNRVVPGEVSVVHLLGPVAVYAIQVVLLAGGLFWSLHAMRRVSLGLFADRAVALASLVPMAGLGLLLTWVGLWTLGLALL
jgi:polyferredoxin